MGIEFALIEELEFGLRLHEPDIICAPFFYLPLVRTQSRGRLDRKSSPVGVAAKRTRRNSLALVGQLHGWRNSIRAATRNETPRLPAKVRTDGPATRLFGGRAHLSIINHRPSGSETLDGGATTHSTRLSEPTNGCPMTRAVRLSGRAQHSLPGRLSGQPLYRRLIGCL